MVAEGNYWLDLNADFWYIHVLIATAIVGLKIAEGGACVPDVLTQFPGVPAYCTGVMPWNNWIPYELFAVAMIMYTMAIIGIMYRITENKYVGV